MYLSTTYNGTSGSSILNAFSYAGVNATFATSGCDAIAEMYDTLSEDHINVRSNFSGSLFMHSINANDFYQLRDFAGMPIRFITDR